MSTETKSITVDAAALHSVLEALNGSPHRIRELQATRDKPPILEGNPIDKLIAQYNEWSRNDGRKPGYDHDPKDGDVWNGVGIETLLENAGKPEEINGTNEQRHARINELLHWFVRLANRNANPKWAHEHAFELAYYIATNGINRRVNLEKVRSDAMIVGFNATPEQRRVLCRLNPDVYKPANTEEKERAFQPRVNTWMKACFSQEVLHDKAERNARFLEEAIELVQACGCTKSEASQVLDYVYGREIGHPFQETGGVMISLAALCTDWDIDIMKAGHDEIDRCYTIIDKIRAKQAQKPKFRSLPFEQETPDA